MLHSVMLRKPSTCYSHWPRTCKVLGGHVNARYSSEFNGPKNSTPEG